MRRSRTPATHKPEKGSSGKAIYTAVFAASLLPYKTSRFLFNANAMQEEFKSVLTRRRRRALEHVEKINSEDSEYVHTFEVDEYGECINAIKFKMPVGSSLLFYDGNNRAAKIIRKESTLFACCTFFFSSGPCYVEHGFKWIDEDSAFENTEHYSRKITVEERFINAFHAADLIRSFGKKSLATAEDFNLLTQRVISERFFIESFKPNNDVTN